MKPCDIEGKGQGYGAGTATAGSSGREPRGAARRRRADRGALLPDVRREMALYFTPEWGDIPLLVSAQAGQTSGDGLLLPG